MDQPPGPYGSVATVWYLEKGLYTISGLKGGQGPLFGSSLRPPVGSVTILSRQPIVRSSWPKENIRESEAVFYMVQHV